MNSVDEFSVSNEKNLELQAGDLIEIAYNGDILESNPAQLGKVHEITVIGQAEAEAMWDRISMVRVNGKLYYDTGKESTADEHYGDRDGQIASEVDGFEIPTENNRSDLGTGFGYQYGEGDTIEIYMNEKWFGFEHREEKEHQSVEPIEPSVVKIYEATDSDTAFENDKLVTMVKYYEMSDGTWKTDTHTYQYRLEITGRMDGAEKDSTFVFLSNGKDILSGNLLPFSACSSLFLNPFLTGYRQTARKSHVGTEDGYGCTFPARQAAPLHLVSHIYGRCFCSPHSPASEWKNIFPHNPLFFQQALLQTPVPH